MVLLLDSGVEEKGGCKLYSDLPRLVPPGGTIVKARLTSQGGTTHKIASILLASTSRTTPRGTTLNARLGWKRGTSRVGGDKSW